MFTTLIVFQVLVAIGLIAIVLVQRGPGATMGAAFGAGASGTVFGSRGAGNFLTRTTGWLALGFFAISLTLAVLATGLSGGDPSSLAGSVMQQQAAGQQAESEQVPGIDSLIDSLESDESTTEAVAEPVDEPVNEARTSQDQGDGSDAGGS